MASRWGHSEVARRIVSVQYSVLTENRNDAFDFRPAALNRNHSRMFAQKRSKSGVVSGKNKQAKHTGSLFARAGKAVPVQDGAAALPSKAARCLQVKAAG